MNKLIIALSVACASACVFADVGATPKPGPTTHWFGADASKGSSGVDGGSFVDWTVVIENNKYVIDSEIDSPVTFTSTGALNKDMASVTFELDTAIVPADVRTSTTLPNTAKVAFSASEVDDTTKGYFAWLGSGWVQLAGATPEEGTSYKLVVTFDNRADGKKVQFMVGDTVLTSNNQEWIPYGTALSGQMSIDLVGSGNVASLKGSQIEISAEVIDVDGGKIEIKEEDVKKFDIPTDMSKDTFFAQKAGKAFSGFKSDISVGAAYALGLIAENESTGKMAPVNGGELIAKALAETPDANGIKLGLNVAPPEGTGATITYQVVDESNAATEGLVIPSSKLGAGLRKFTVKAIVTPAAE